MRALVLCALLALPAAAQPELGSKAFTESVILGEIARLRLKAAEISVRHRQELGGTRVLFSAIERGDIAAYPDYTGTLRFEIFARDMPADDAALQPLLAEKGLGLTPPLGFNNSYALAMRRDRAAALGIETISDLRAHPDLVFGFSNEFVDREDGWPALAAAYALPQTRVRGLQHDLAYRGLVEGAIDVVDAYGTDAEIAAYDLVTLEDDRSHFPRYDAVFVYRLDLPPALRAALTSLGGTIDVSEMIAMNRAVKIDRQSETAVAAAFVRDTLGRSVTVTAGPGWTARLGARIAEHLTLVAVSLGLALGIALPLGIAAAYRPMLGQAVLAGVGVLQTIPSLALLVLLIPLFGIGATPTIAALFLYSLLPIVRNTHAGLTGIAGPLRDAGRAIGLPGRARLLRIDLPLALPTILAGIKTAAVINVGTATLGALIGAGGLGQPILTGIRLDDFGLILEGAVPAALLALAVVLIFDGLERLVVPKPLRLRHDRTG
ncbi:MAG: glycine betaine ABC transporter substrate-binding protein [Rhodothalassiaceae bacterium]